jgi:hypothetical protein
MLIAMARDAKKRRANRQVKLKEFEANIDPAGFHVLAFQMIHNDVEIRTLWMTKMTGVEQPVEIWLDVSFDKFNEAIETSVAK